MKLIMMRSDVNLAGPGRMILGLVRALKSNGVQSILISGGGVLEESIDVFCEKTINIPELKRENRSLFNTFKAAFILRKIILNEKKVIIHSHNAHCAIVALIAKILCLNLSIKIVNTVHGEGKENLLKFLPIRIIAVSEYLKRHLINCGIRDEKIRVIHNSLIPLDDIISNKDLLNKLNNKHRKNKIKIINIGMFTGYKGQELLLKKLFSYPERDNFEVHFVGDGVSLNSCVKYVKENGIDHLVIFHGKLDNVLSTIDICDLMIHMSPQETFGLVLAESMARGVPCIVNNVGGVSEVVANNVTGFTIEEHDNIFFIAESLFNDNEKYHDFSLLSVERTKSLFVCSIVAKNYIREYNA